MHRRVESHVRALLIVALLAASSAARSEEAGKDESDGKDAEQPTVEEILSSKPSEDDYKTERRCVRSTSIERTEILNDRLIVFHLKRGDEKLLLQFPQRCPGLRRDVTLLYEKGDTSRICEHDTVQARLDLGVASRWGPRCILPAFESVTAQQIEYLKAELRRRPPAEEKPQASEATGSGT
jgi:hypothetical protein